MKRSKFVANFAASLRGSLTWFLRGNVWKSIKVFTFSLRGKFSRYLRQFYEYLFTCVLRGKIFVVITRNVSDVLTRNLYVVFTRKISDVLTRNLYVVFTTKYPPSLLRRNYFLANLRRISEDICVTTNV